MSDLIKEVLGSTLHESTIEYKVNHPNILKSEESWIQFRDLKTIELNISMPLCRSDLAEYLDNHTFVFIKISNFLTSNEPVLIYLKAKKNLSGRETFEYSGLI